MGNGCLKPTPRNGQIYIDCINHIYEELKELQSFDSKNGSDIYSFIKDKINKKGWLRKLMDNLTSHRQNIPDAALHNFRLMAQSKGIHFKLAGLIVIDYIINAVLRESGLELGQKMTEMVFKMIIKQKDVNAESDYQQSETRKQPQNITKVNRSLSQVVRTASSIQNLENLEQKNKVLQTYLNNNNMSYFANQSLVNQSTHRNSLMLREIYNVKFSNIFYSMIHSLVSTEDAIYSYCVKSIIIYTRYHSVKNIQQEKILDLLQILLQHVQTGEEVNLSLKAYEMLVKKLRDSFMQNQITKFKVFLKIWEQSFTQSNEQQNQLFSVNSENRFLLESIIHKMISSMIGSVAVNKIYQQIIAVYDDHNFENMLNFEEMLITITKKDELKSQFFRGLYSFLLSYLAVCRGNGVGQGMKNISLGRQNTSGTVLSRKWGTINPNKTLQSLISQYENILSLQTKRKVISTLKRWVHSYEFIQINQIIKYNSSLFINSFLLNIHELHLADQMIQPVSNNNLGGNANSLQQSARDTNKKLIKFLYEQFCQSFCRNAEIQQRICLVNILFDEVKLQEISDQEKTLYFDMISLLLFEELIQANKIIDFCHLDPSFTKSMNIMLIQTVTWLISKFTEKMLIKQVDQIAYFLFSLFELLTKMSLPYNQTIQLLTKAIKLIQVIERSQGSLIILAFTQRMIKAISSQMGKYNFFICWDLILNCSYTLLGSPRNYSREQNKKELNQVYIKTTLNQQLKTTAAKITQQEFDQKVEKIILDAFGNINEQKQQRIFVNAQLPKPEDFQNHSTVTGSHEKLYELSSIAFRDMFNRGVSCAKSGFFPIHEEQASCISQNGGFSRANSIIREEDIGHEQKSIADVMEMIHL